jgi:hypothetical protein
MDDMGFTFEEEEEDEEELPEEDFGDIHSVSMIVLLGYTRIAGRGNGSTQDPTNLFRLISINCLQVDCLEADQDTARCHTRSIKSSLLFFTGLFYFQSEVLAFVLIEQQRHLHRKSKTRVAPCTLVKGNILDSRK